jgi:hypothetical protein
MTEDKQLDNNLQNDETEKLLQQNTQFFEDKILNLVKQNDLLKKEIKDKDLVAVEYQNMLKQLKEEIKTYTGDKDTNYLYNELSNNEDNKDNKDNEPSNNKLNNYKSNAIADIHLDDEIINIQNSSYNYDNGWYGANEQTIKTWKNNFAKL